MRLIPTADNLLLRTGPPGAQPGQLQRVQFKSGEQFWGAGEPISQILFPLRGLISLQAVTGDKPADVALVGREGCTEITSLLGAKQTRMRAVALTDGEAMVMHPRLFRRCLDDAKFRAALERYLRLYVVMLSHMGVCNRVHTIDKSLTGRLLLMQDRTGSESFQTTQDFLSQVLGVRKATVNRAAAGLRSQGAISYDRKGGLKIADRRQLESHACSCYRAIKDEWDELIAAGGGL